MADKTSGEKRKGKKEPYYKRCMDKPVNISVVAFHLTQSAISQRNYTYRLCTIFNTFLFGRGGGEEHNSLLHVYRAKR